MRLRFSRLAPDVLSLAALSAVVVLVYIATDAPLYNPPSSLDPWLYTGLFVNFNQIFRAFHTTYYASRLAWIIPGHLANELLSPKAAYLLYHGTLFFAGGLLLFLLVRAYYGRVPALVAYVSLLGNQLYYNGHRWDYWDGPIVTYLAGTFYFALVPWRGRWRWASYGLSGAFAVAAVTTNLVSALLVLGVAVVYRFSDAWRGLRGFTCDLAGFAAGAFVVLAACSIYSVAHGGAVNYLDPQLRALVIINNAQFKQPYGQWLPQEPLLLVPLFLIAAGGLLLRHNARSRMWRFGAGCWLYLAATTVTIAGWEFLLGGYFLEYAYYFSMLNVAIWLCLATIVYLCVCEWGTRVGAAVVLAAVAATIVPDLALFRRDALTDFGRSALIPSSFVIVGALALLVLTRMRSRYRAFVTVAAAGAAVAAVAFPIDSSLGVYGVAASDPTAGSYFRLGTDLISYLRANGFARHVPAFWYDETADNYALRGLQSLYIYNLSYAGTHLPRIDEDFRSRLSALDGHRLVLLCATRRCDNAEAALRGAGYHARLADRARLSSGPVHVWLHVDRVANPQSPIAG